MTIGGGFTGKLYFYTNNKWGLVCDNLWSGSYNANYICYSMNLNYGSASYASLNMLYYVGGEQYDYIRYRWDNTGISYAMSNLRCNWSNGCTYDYYAPVCNHL